VYDTWDRWGCGAWQKIAELCVVYQFAEGSKELEEVMTDKDGKNRRITTPPGTMREEA
jgi:hypothetical protein